MTTSKMKFRKIKLQDAQSLEDECLTQADILKRRTVRAENLRKARNATKLYQQYKNSPEQFRMTFSEYKRRQGRG